MLCFCSRGKMQKLRQAAGIRAPPVQNETGHRNWIPLRQEHQAKDSQPEFIHSPCTVLHIASNCQHPGSDQKFIQDKARCIMLKELLACMFCDASGSVLQNAAADNAKSGLKIDPGWLCPENSAFVTTASRASRRTSCQSPYLA